TDIWQKFKAWTPSPDNGQHACIGTPAHIRGKLQTFADAGVDQVIFIQQGGRNQHAHICESMELFAREVMPALKAGEAAREQLQRAADVRMLGAAASLDQDHSIDTRVRARLQLTATVRGRAP